MNWNEAIDIEKDENVWKTLIKDCPVQQILQFQVGVTSILMLPQRRVIVFICDIG